MHHEGDDDMLCLAMKIGRMITISIPGGDDIVLRLYEIGQGQVKIGFSAPREYTILRNELIKETPDETPIVNPDWVRGAQEGQRTTR